MVGSDAFWQVAGVSTIKEKSDGDGYHVRIPDKLFEQGEADILEVNKDIAWSYEVHTKVVIVSNKMPHDDRYEEINSVSFSDSEPRYYSTIPKEFFPEYQGRGSPATIPEAVQNINLPTDGSLIFVYNEEMAEGQVRSSYALTEEQFDNRFSDSSVYPALDNAPKFS